jgi:hypothetical protein
VSIDALRNEVLDPTVGTTTVVGARPDCFIQRERWCRAALELLTQEAPEPTGELEPPAIDDFGMDL